MEIKKETVKKFFGFWIPKLIIIFLSVVGCLHLWYNVNYCSIEYIDTVDYFNTGNITYNRTIFANFNQMTYFFNDSGGHIYVPSNAVLRCGIFINPPEDP